MSNYYLCDVCEKKFAVEDPKAAVSPYCQCEPIPEVHHKVVIYRGMHRVRAKEALTRKA